MSKRITLGDLKRATKPPVTVKAPTTVAEWDVTPGLHEWIEGEIKRREGTARAPRHPSRVWEYDHVCGEVRDQANAGTVAFLGRDDPAGLHIELHDPASALRRCAADRKILAAHPYTWNVVNPSYGTHGAEFGCETCHDWDGVTEGRGNCATILALAEGYGLEPAGERDVEVIRG